jgi:hypothetical protein
VPAERSTDLLDPARRLEFLQLLLQCGPLRHTGESRNVTDQLVNKAAAVSLTKDEDSTTRSDHRKKSIGNA